MQSPIHLRQMVLGNPETFLNTVDICLEECVPYGVKDREGYPIHVLCFSFILFQLPLSDFAPSH